MVPTPVHRKLPKGLKEKTTTRIKPPVPKRYIVVKRTFDLDGDGYTYKSPSEVHEVGYTYDDAVEMAKGLAKEHEGGCYFVANIVAKAESIVSVAYEMKEYD